MLKESVDLDILEVRFDSKMIFEKHHHSVQLLKDLVPLGSPGEYSMICCFLGDAFEILSSPFCSTVLQCGSRLEMHNLNYRTVSSVVPVFLTGSVFECDIAHCRSRAVL